MGNSIRKLNLCFTDAGEVSRRHHDIPIVFTAGTPLDEGLGHSFCYIPPDPCRLSSSKVYCEEETAMIQKKTTTFRCISGASVSANTSTPLSTCLIDVYTYNSFDRASSFESSTSFVSIPLQPVPRLSPNSIETSLRNASSGPIERGFLSGPIERGFASGPIEKGLYSGPIEKVHKNYTHNEVSLEHKSKKRTLVNTVRKVIANAIFLNSKSIGGPIKGVFSVKESDWAGGLEKSCENFVVSSNNLSSQASLNFDEYDGDESLESQNLQWAQGKAGEDRVHIVISEENGWVFIGIYDGFNGPDAPDFLISNLYSAVHKELKGLLWNDKSESEAQSIDSEKEASLQNEEVIDQSQMRNGMANSCFEQDRRENSDEGSNGFVGIDHSDVLKALSRALLKTEEAYLDIADRMLVENPELALMGSCVLVMLMKGEDVYLMNVGDSRAVLAQKKTEPDASPKRKARQDLARINEETLRDFQSRDDGDEFCGLPYLTSLQLTLDHSTNVEEEVKRIMSEHLDDASAVVNDRVKGSLKVTRAFGAGFLKQPKWNNALLEMFRIDYVGTSPYITCLPSLHHHKLNPRDRFLILSSDGLYQYFTNEEAVSEVELFMDLSPEGDPAQHLIEELLFRAAKKAGMDFHELLDIPQGDRRRYHDDVSIIIISLEGRIWRSSV